MEDTYISLQEAAECCSYSQEYLSLRARQGKLKSVKFGRNWVTKKEWVEEYLTKNIKSQIPNSKQTENVDVRRQQFTGGRPLRVLRFRFLFGLAFVLLTAGIMLARLNFSAENFGGFGKESLTEFSENFEQGTALVFNKIKRQVQDWDNVVTEFGEGTDRLLGNIGRGIKNYTLNLKEGVGIAFDELNLGAKKSFNKSALLVIRFNEDIDGFLNNFGLGFGTVLENTNRKIFKTVNGIDAVAVELNEGVDNFFTNFVQVLSEGAVISAGDFFSTIIDNLKEFSWWLTRQTFAVGQKIVHPVRNVFSKTPNFIKSVISNGVKSYLTANDFVERKISQGIMGLKKIPEIVTQPFRPKIIVIEKLPPEAEKNITELQGKVKELEEKIPKEVVKEKEVEVSRITKIEPIKEITRETIVTKIDEAELAKLKTQTAQFSLWGTDIENLRAITKKLQATPTYTPAPSAPIYIGYQGIQVGGTGTFASLGVSGSAGIGDLGVGGSTSLGSSSADTLTVNAASYLKSPVTFGTGALTIDTSGNLTTTGIVTLANTTRADQFEISVNSEGKVIFDASSGRIQLAAGNNFYTEDGGPIGRAVGEEIFRAAVPIYRYGMPSQTSNSTNFVRVSKYFATTSDISIPAALTGTTRVYRLVINYSDDIPVASSSSWQIVNSAGTTVHATFTLPGQNATTLEEGKPFLTGLVAIPDTDWQVEVKMPTGKNIRIFQIYLVVYDQVQ